jgi:CHAT domain
VLKASGTELKWDMRASFDPSLGRDAVGPGDLVVDIGSSPRDLAARLLRRMPYLRPGEHMTMVQSIGELLWDKTPKRFQHAYSEACEQCGEKGLSIQFVTNEPYVPWELMRPVVRGAADVLLGQRHAVSRTIFDYVGQQPLAIASGPIVTIAPSYADPRQHLPSAIEESKRLVAEFGAEAIEPATRDAILAFMESGRHLGVLHFAGHGKTDRSGDAVLLLQDGERLTALELRRNEVKQTLRGTLIVLNACEVATPGSLLGAYLGWAETFSRAGCAAFVAPLWSVNDHIAGALVVDLLRNVFIDRLPVAEALRRARVNYGHISADVFAYVAVGDVSARLCEE